MIPARTGSAPTATPRADLPPLVATEVRRMLGLPSGDWQPRTGGPIASQVLKRRVHRVRVTAGASRSFIVKQVTANVAQRNRLVVERWLPAIGLEASSPALLGIVAAPDHTFSWLVFEDVDGVVLKQCQDDPASVVAAIHVIAQLHTRAAGHAIVRECRREDADLGMRYFATNVSRASKLLQELRPPAVSLTRQQAGLRDRLCRRLDVLGAEQPRRAELMAEAGGPDTMLHGDLWTTNLLIVDTDGRAAARLIDWDHVGAGPICYDLSTFLYRFARPQRGWVLDAYREAVARAAGWRLPPVAALNLLCDTAECARYANRIIWPAIALLQYGAAWGFTELAAIDRWFEALEPVLDD